MNRTLPSFLLEAVIFFPGGPKVVMDEEDSWSEGEEADFNSFEYRQLEDSYASSGGEDGQLSPTPSGNY